MYLAFRLIAIAAVILLSPLLAFSQSHAHGEVKASAPTAAQQAFEQFKKLDGAWKGKSTKGWGRH
jgi:hypothetical protein